MAGKQDEPMFEETTNLPSGRKARTVPDEVWAHLEDAAKRGVGFSRTAAPHVIDDLRKDLGSAAVRAKYHVTLGTEKLSDTRHKLTFSARHKPPVASTTNEGQSE